MYYSTTQVCRCNEETRTNSNETSLIGQPLFDTETIEKGCDGTWQEITLYNS